MIGGEDHELLEFGHYISNAAQPCVNPNTAVAALPPVRGCSKIALPAVKIHGRVTLLLGAQKISNNDIINTNKHENRNEASHLTRVHD